MFTLAGLSLRALHLGFAFRCAPRLAVVVQLDEASCEDESGRTGLVADAQIFLLDAELLAQLRQGALDAEVAASCLSCWAGFAVRGKRR